jgi:ABC-2 type transport system ATP-binding protein
MEAAIELRGLVKAFGTHRAVSGLSFDVPAGSIFGLLGRNGAGKTTTIRMIMDIIRPDSGELRVLGAPMGRVSKDRIGYLPEERGLYPKMRVLDVLEFQGTIKGLDPAEARRRAQRWLGPWTTKRVEELSKGMQQKVQFIAAILVEPELLVLDEPFSGMDPVNQDLFKELILELHRQVIDRGGAVLNDSVAAIKQSFGNNSLLLEYDGDGSFLRTLPGVAALDDYGRYVEVRLEPDAEPQRVLEAAVARVLVRRFEIVTPTLHNIFIQKVGAEKAHA